MRTTVVDSVATQLDRQKALNASLVRELRTARYLLRRALVRAGESPEMAELTCGFADRVIAQAEQQRLCAPRPFGQE